VICKVTEIDGETTFEARVLELPDVAGYGDTREEAEEAAIEAIRGLQSSAEAAGRSFPRPLVEAHETGRFTLRLSRDLHTRAAVFAALGDVSLNTFISNAVAAQVSRLESQQESLAIGFRATTTPVSSNFNVIPVEQIGAGHNLTVYLHRFDQTSRRGHISGTDRAHWGRSATYTAVSSGTATRAPDISSFEWPMVAEGNA
jgi:predicted HicB family RNase H-like nuclease